MNLLTQMRMLAALSQKPSSTIMGRFIHWMMLVCLGATLAGCASDKLQQQALLATTTSDAANNWLRIQIDPSMQPDAAWQKLMDSVTGYYPDLEMIDVPSGYIRSVYTVRQFGAPAANGSFQVRTRFVCTIASKTPLVYKIKIESEMSMQPYGEWAPYSRVFNQDQSVIEELQNRLGVK